MKQKGSFTPESSDPKKKDRGQWDNQAQFILSCLGYAMGLGNVWKFPYTCFSNGGGAYLIPYIVVLALIGIPIFFLELIMGQYSGKGPIEVWCVSPIFQGAGIGMLLINSMICIFYTMLLAYCLYYFAACFTSTLPWDSCNHDYNTPDCFSQTEAKPCLDLNGIWYNNTCYNTTFLNMFREIRTSCGNDTDTFNQTIWQCYNYTINTEAEFIANMTGKRVSASSEYYYRGVLEQSPSISETNGLKWQLVLCLLAMWIVCFLCLIKGIQSSGKIVYFTTTFPYVVLTILLIRGALLEGAIDGVKYLVTPNWQKLADGKVWGDAAGQIFFALSVGVGGLLTYSSYCPFKSNIYRNALMVAVFNACTDWFAGFVVFTALGYMAHTQNKNISDVAAKDSGLAFVVYPQVLATLPIPQLWSALFFFMLVLLGLDSLTAGVEALITATVDKWPHLRRVKILVTAFWCVVLFLGGLTMCTRAGSYWLDLIGYYSAGWSLVVMGIVEFIVFSWIYGSKKVMAHVKEMCGFKLYPQWWVAWTFVSPLLLIAVLIFNLIYFKPLSWNDETPPVWVPILGWFMTLSPLGIIIIGAIVMTIKSFMKSDGERTTCIKRFGKLFQPNKNWMPAYERDALEEASKKQTYTANADGNDNNGGVVNEGADCDYVEANGVEWNGNMEANGGKWNGNGDPGFTSIDPSSDFDGIVLEEFQRNDVMHRRVSPSLNGHAVANDDGNEFADVRM